MTSNTSPLAWSPERPDKPTSPFALFADALPLEVNNQGEGQPYLLLHGGAGPASMAGLAAVLAQQGRAVLPTMPGFDAQPRPPWFRRVDDLVLAYLALIERLDLRNVVVVGNSLGGWVAAELGLRASPRIAALVLINAVGLDPTPTGGGIANPSTLAPAELAARAFYDPARFAVAPSGPEAQARMAANRASLNVYAGEPFMHDPELRARLPTLVLPTLVLWGESDGIVTPAYGRQFTDLIQGAQFEPVRQAGHFPQIEQRDAVAAKIEQFAPRA